jgi:hypothetical protein
LSVDDVVFYNNYALIDLKLKPTTIYTIKNKLKAENIEKKALEKKSNSTKIQKDFVFTTPENKYL